MNEIYEIITIFTGACLGLITAFILVLILEIWCMKVGEKND